jgi:hypothetical protein
MSTRAALLVQHASGYLLLERVAGVKDPALAREHTVNRLRIDAFDLGFAADEIRSAVENAIRKATA